MNDFIREYQISVEKYPENISVSFNGNKMTYRELDETSNKIANYLLINNVREGDVVGVRIDRSIELLTSIVAIFKCKAIYLPIDKTLPEERQKHLINKSQCKFILENESTSQEKNVKNLNIKSALSHSEKTNFCYDSKEDHIAYIIFTSGTTGNPKGVMVKHSGMINHIKAKVNELRLNVNSKVAQTAPQSFDISIWQFLSALTVGGETVIIDKNIQLDPIEFIKKLNAERVSVVQFVPSLFNTFINSIENYNDIKIKTLKNVATVGEPLLPITCRKWFSLYKNIPILNHYGPTECSDGVAHYLIKEMSDIPDNITPIGEEISGIKLYVCEMVNNQLREITEPFKTGELYVSGIGVSAGYINDPDKTRSVFLKNPFSTEAKYSVIYKTGDLVRYNAAHQLECLGRTDRQVKVRGHRIELAEIENRLAEIPVVKECAVICKREDKIKLAARDIKENEYISITNLVGYVIGNESLTRKFLVEKLKTHLPDYMIPDYFILCTQLPHNSNGKIDYKKLKDFNKVRPLTDSPFIPAKTEKQGKLCEIYSEITGVHPVSIKDMFVELGGDSLRGMLVVNQISKEFSVNLKISDIYTYNIEQLEEILNKDREKIEKIKVTPDQQRYPLTAIQKQLWFLWKLNPTLKNYILQTEIVSDREINSDLIKESWSAAVKNFDTLRIKFIEENGEPYFQIKKYQPVNVEEVNLAECEFNSFDDYRKQILSKSFDLTTDNLFYFKIVKKNDETKILLTTHEIVMDAWSLSVLVKYITRYYRFLIGKGNEPEQSLIGFKDYAVWENNHRTPDKLHDESNFWRDQLSGNIEAIRIPSEFHHDRKVTYLSDSVSMTLPPECVRKIEELSIDNNLTKYTIILSAFYILLNQYSGNKDLIVGSPHVVRDIPGTENLIGFFLNMIPMRIKSGLNKNFLELCKEVSSTVNNSISNSAYPFSSMVNNLHVERSEYTHPIFQIMFNMYSEKSEKTNNDINFFAREKDNGYAKYDIVLYCQEDADSISLQLSYAQDIYDRAIIKRLSDQLIYIIQNCLNNGKEPISNLNLVKESNKSIKRGKINNYNNSYAKFDIYQSFLTRCKANSSAIAYYSKFKNYSYGQLYELIEEYSSFIVENIEDRLCLAFDIDRGIESVALILSALKLNIPYVSLNSNYPNNRIKDIISSLKPGVFISDSSNRLQTLHGKVFRKLIHSDDGSKDLFLYKLSEPQKYDFKDVLQIVYTSGSTGMPKAVKILKKSVLNRLFWMWSEFPFSPDDICIVQKSTSLVASTWEVLGGLLQGIPSVLTDENEVRDPYLLFNLLSKYKVSRLLCSPAILKGLILVGQKTNKPNLLPDLKFVTSSAETIYPQVAKDFMRIYTNAHLYNFYGSTECSSNAAVHRIEGQDLNSLYIPVGEPLYNVNLYILNKENRIVSKGAIGELAVSGDCLSSGYLSIDDNAFYCKSCDVNELVYKTGDIAKINANNDLVLLGRNDNLVKVDGFRVELDEIQNCILNIPSVVDATTVVVKDGVENRIISYVVVNENSKEYSADEAIRKNLKETLPSYSIPYKLIIVDSIPKLPSGKIDKKKLPGIDLTRANTNTIIEPKNKLQQQIADVWKLILQIDRVSILDSFFDLGGTSMMSLTCVSELSKLSIDITVSDLYNTSNLEELSALITDRDSKDMNNDNNENIKEFTVSPTVSYLLNRQNVGERYNISKLWVDINLTVDENVLKDTIRMISSTYSVLRTKAIDKNKKINLFISDEPIKLEKFDLGNISDTEDVDSFLSEFCNKIQGEFKFDGKSLLSRFISVDLSVASRKRRYFLFIMHHSLIDCYSFEMLVSEIDKYYKNLLIGGECRPAYKDISQINIWLNLLKEKLNSNALNLYSHWLKNLKLLEQTKTVPAVEKLVNFSSKEIYYALKESRNCSLLAHNDYSVFSRKNLSVIKFSSNISDKLRFFKHNEFDSMDLVLYSIHSGFANTQRYLFVDNLDMTRMININNIDLSTCIGFVVAMFPLFLDYEGETETLTKLKRISDIKNDKFAALFLRGLDNLLEISIPDDLSLSYPNILINNHIALSGYSNDEFLNLDSVNIWSGNSTGADLIHNVRINIEVTDAHVYLDILYQDGYCDDAIIKKLADSLVSILNEFA